MAGALALNQKEKTVAAAPQTPMMQQYLAVKKEHPDCLLFYRMGDFYELFFEDAVEAAEVLDIALTKRGKHEAQDIPMCGVPFHSYEPYLEKLIRHGFKVAICEQMESPEEAKKRGYKAVVKREVVRIVTPGTLTEEGLLDTKQANYLGALVKQKEDMALAWLDISTGEFNVSPTSPETLASDLSRLSMKELLVSEALYNDPDFAVVWQEWKAILTPYTASLFDYSRAENGLKQCYGVFSLEAFGNFSKSEIAACGALIEYVSLTQKGLMPRLVPPVRMEQSDFMVMDAATRRNLELVTSFSGGRKGSLLHVIDCTITGAGARLLGAYLAAPLASAVAVNDRLENVQFFYDNSHLRQDMRKVLKHVPDMERALSRICLQRGSPRDLTSLRDGLREAIKIAELIEYSGISLIPQGITALSNHIGSYDILLEELTKALKHEVGALARDGGFVAAGYHIRIDELRALQENSRQALIQLQEKYRKETGVNNLKVTHNNVLGYFVEVTPQHTKKIPEEVFVHRQTLASAVRYTTEELKTLESDIVNAKDKVLKLELEVFDQLIQSVQAHANAIVVTAQALASLDVAAALAELAVKKKYTRPTVDNSLDFVIKGGRHPVVEDNLHKELASGFIANDCDLSAAQRLWLLTGPNMAGKSTFLRQNALIAILAQIGSFVPADYVHIGMVDRLFSRVGAADDLARGRSTFMVEMVETATILNQATSRSLVILDEIGRGTATFDGLSIAWSVVEHIHHSNQCRALFATHYHELTSLAAKLPHLCCHTMKVREWEGRVVFMHEVVAGAADRSYGIHVARLAGLPASVLSRAEDVLHTLERCETTGKAAKELSGDLPLFSYQREKPATEPKPSVLEEKVKHANVDEMTPKQALDFLYLLKKEIS